MIPKTIEEKQKMFQQMLEEKQKGLNEYEVAKKFGVSHGTYRNWSKRFGATTKNVTITTHNGAIPVTKTTTTKRTTSNVFLITRSPKAVAEFYKESLV